MADFFELRPRRRFRAERAYFIFAAYDARRQRDAASFQPIFADFDIISPPLISA